MKRLSAILILVTVVSAALFTACGSSSQESAASSSEASSEEPAPASSEESAEPSEEPKPVVGGWAVNTDTAPSLSDEDKEIFEAATEKLMGVNYVPVSVLATQVVSGTNRAYLCTGTVVAPDEEASWHTISVYSPLSGDPEVIGIFDLDPNDLATIPNVDDAEIVGGWQVTEDDGATLPDGAKEAFEKAVGNMMGVKYSPIALLSTQVVSGTNYRILCRGTTATETPVTSVYVIDIYADLNGNAETSDVQILDLTKYVGQNQ